jgi:hypothetical protein
LEILRRRKRNIRIFYEVRIQRIKSIMKNYEYEGERRGI